MLSQREEWYRSAIAALLTVTTSVSAIGQVHNRVTSRATEFGDLNQLLKDNTGGAGLDNRANIFNHMPDVDLSGVDPRVVRNLLAESVTASSRRTRGGRGHEALQGQPAHLAAEAHGYRQVVRQSVCAAH